VTSPIYRFHDGEGTRTIDLRSVQSVYRYDGRAIWAVGGLNYLFDVPARAGEELEAVWIAYVNGEHAPTPDVGAPGLPAGWSLKRGADVVVGPDGERVYVDADGWVHGAGFVPLAVVEEAIRAYHARAGGAA
jgi:hypothetical protein